MSSCNKMINFINKSCMLWGLTFVIMIPVSRVDLRNPGTAKTASSVFLVDTKRATRGREGGCDCHLFFPPRSQEKILVCTHAIY